ncbi:hypothetical protein CBL_20117 [Carabus blaptoides fortunei]
MSLTERLRLHEQRLKEIKDFKLEDTTVAFIAKGNTNGFGKKKPSISTSIEEKASTTAQENKWDDVLPKIQFAINNTVHKGTKKTPSELLFGYAPKSQMEKAIVNELSQEPHAVDIAEIARTNPSTFREGDTVLVEKPVQATGGSKKLAPIYDGPMKVIEVLENDRYRVKDTRKGYRKQKYEAVFAVDKIRKFSPESESD